MRPDSPSARDIASMLIARGAGEDGSAAESVQPIVNALGLAAAGLSRWVGPNGCRALLSRALTRAGQKHPALANIQVANNSRSGLVGVEESIKANGAKAVAAGLDVVLVELFELLGRVISPELTLKIAEQITADQPLGAPEEDEEDQP